MPEMIKMNGAEPEEHELAARDAARFAAREAEPVIETAELPAGTEPFDQTQHDQILRGLDSYAHAYDERVNSVNAHNRRLADDMLKQVAKVKAEITTMWLLGGAIASKERQDLAFVEKSERELEKLEHST
jgi:hypothetical protein